jgi:hypothetical protein
MAKKSARGEPRVPLKTPSATRGNRTTGPSKFATRADSAMRGGKK